jgi:hypothetical protein
MVHKTEGYVVIHTTRDHHIQGVYWKLGQNSQCVHYLRDDQRYLESLMHTRNAHFCLPESPLMKLLFPLKEEL